MTRYPIELGDDDTTTNRGVTVAITPEIRALAHRAYPLVVTHDEQDGWVGYVPDLPGLVVAGDTVEEMLHLLTGAKEVYVASLVRRGHPVPEPRPVEAIVSPASGTTADVAIAAADGD